MSQTVIISPQSQPGPQTSGDNEACSILLPFLQSQTDDQSSKVEIHS